MENKSMQINTGKVGSGSAPTSVAKSGGGADSVKGVNAAGGSLAISAAPKHKGPEHCLICDYLRALKVPFTVAYSDQQFESMPFKTLFGFSKLLEKYGVDSQGYDLSADKSEISALPVPFIAKTVGGLVIVTDVGDNRVSYLTEGVPEEIARDEFFKVWDGRVMVSEPRKGAKEPDYGLHARVAFAMKAKKWVLAACCLALFAYLFITNGIYTHVSTILLSLIDLGGIYVTYLLVQKSLKIHNTTADHFCGILQEGGCDSVLEMKASKFFGLFGWSEVGFSYFSVSLLALLMFPSMLPTLALCNVCCLPFTFWSIWYQRFRAHKWCTMCVTVQCSLWLLFFCYLFGGWLREAWPPTIHFIVLGVTYVGVMLGLNALMPLIEKD